VESAGALPVCAEIDVAKRNDASAESENLDKDTVSSGNRVSLRPGGEAKAGYRRFVTVWRRNRNAPGTGPDCHDKNTNR
jgi:hypothetical protein